MRLAGKTAIITGAGSGMGRQGALTFSREGANVVIGDIDMDNARATLEAVQATGGQGVVVHADVTHFEDNQRLVEVALGEFGNLHIAWANAGLPAPFMDIRRYDLALFEHLLSVNVRGPWLLARAAVDPLRVTRGSFIVTASLSGLKGRANHSGYQISKGGAVMLVRSLAREFAPFGVRVNSLCPVAAETPMLEKFLTGVNGDIMSIEELRAGVPMGRLASVEDVANAALFFASDESAFVTGVNLPIDGGASA